MRILVVGAGAIGGYFGGRLLEAGANVTFLLRARRSAQIEQMGLVISSTYGDVAIPAPPQVRAGTLGGTYDLIIVACKSYDLPETIEAFAPAVGPQTAVLPLLNGMQHLDALVERFGDGHVLGGLCMISSTLDEAGAIVHLNDIHSLTFGELDGPPSGRTDAIAAVFARAKFESQVSDGIRLDMWEKWTFIASTGCINTLMRAPVGDIVAAGAADLALAMYDECCDVAERNGFATRQPARDRTRGILTKPGSLLTASLLKDVERGGRTEGEHIVGDLVRRGGDLVGATSLLRVAYAHLKAYELKRQRMSSAS